MFIVDLLPLAVSGSYPLEDPDSYAAKLTLRGSLSLENSAEISLFIDVASKGGIRTLLLNLEHLPYIDSSGIGLIIRARKLFKAAGGYFALLNVPPKVNEAFDLVNLREYVPIFYSDDKALDAARGSRADRGGTRP
jgi:anti-anti-sigma factor